MMNHLQYEPWLMLNVFNREMDRLMLSKRNAAANPVKTWTPPVDIIEEETQFRLLMDVPGIDPKGIEVSMEKGVLEVSGEHQLADQVAENSVSLRRERVQGAFKRRFTLPQSADNTEIRARSENGVLEIAIKKRVEEQPRRISVTH